MTITEVEKDEKKVISIYKIDSQLEELNKEDKNAWENIQKIITNCKYNPERLELKNDFLNKYDRECYKLHYPNTIGWEKFVDEFLENKLSLNTSINNSILLLLKPKEQTDDIFVIGFGNLAYFAIQKYIDTNFGLDILSRIIDPNSNIVKSAKGQNVVGSTQGQLSIYRQLHSLSDIEDFGKIFQELNASIKKEFLEKFGIETDKDFKNCCAKSSFQIRTSITSDTIEKYIDGCLEVKTLPAQPINSSRQLDKKKDKDLIKKIKENAVKELLQKIIDGGNIEICHKDFDKYLNATTYKCTYGSKRENFSFDKTLKDLKDLFKINEENFKNFLNLAKITSYDTDETSLPLTKDKLLNHLFIEHDEIVGEQHQKYFILNGDIYKLEDSFIGSLNNKIKNFKNRDLFVVENNLTTWNTKDSETKFNDSYLGKDGYIVVHPYPHKNVELCDLIKYNCGDGNLYLYFVKDGFSGTIRDLSYQVFNTAKIIENDKASNYKYLGGFYDAFTKAHADRTTLSKDKFIELFSKRIIYVFAFRDENNKSLKDNPELFGSNIAKFSLIDLIQKMNTIDNGSLKIEQIECV